MLACSAASLSVCSNSNVSDIKPNVLKRVGGGGGCFFFIFVLLCFVLFACFLLLLLFFVCLLFFFWGGGGGCLLACSAASLSVCSNCNVSHIKPKILKRMFWGGFFFWGGGVACLLCLLACLLLACHPCSTQSVCKGQMWVDDRQICSACQSLQPVNRVPRFE